MAVFRRFANLFRRSSVDQEIEDELQAHIAMRVEANIAAGMLPTEARRQALLQFGNPSTTKERVTAADANLTLGGFWRNVRFALRQLRRSPRFALTAILALALGIGPNVAIFSIIWATFLAPSPFPHANQLVVVWNHYKGDRIPTRGEDYAQYAAESRSFESLSFQSWIVVHLTNSDHTADMSGGLGVSPGLQTRTVGEPMALGRDFLPDEGGPGKDHVVILSHWLWQHRYNSDPNIVGKPILVEDQPYTVVGVTPAGPNDQGGGVEFNVPVRLTPGVHSPHFGIMIGRLKPGVTLAQAQAELSVINSRLFANVLVKERGQANGSNAISITVEHFRNDWLDVKTQRNLWLLLEAVSLVLLIACANIANLLLARGASRSQELAVRSALGATRRQIFAQLLTESLTLAVFGGALGITMGWGIMRLSIAIFPDLALQSSDTLVEMNLPVLCFSIAIAFIAGIVSGCAPSWRATRLNLSETLKQGSRSVGGRGRTPLQSALVTSEIALALILLAGAGMALHSFWNLSHIDVGFTPDHLMTALLRPRDNSARGGKQTFPPPEQIVVQQHQLLDRIRAIPGVADAAFATTLPLHGTGIFPFTVAGQPDDPDHAPVADFEAVSPSYFNTLGIRLVRGRFLRDTDTYGSPPVV
ncbi:MAG: ABC transporter permease, partial [Terracidiphilus sp.]